jgi:hypothetical protein
MDDAREYVNDADLADQESPLDDDLDEVEVDTSDLEVDEVDRWEQAVPVRYDDDVRR